METYSLLALLFFMAVCFLPALTAAVFRPGEWYEQLAKHMAAAEPIVRAGVDHVVFYDRLFRLVDLARFKRLFGCPTANSLCSATRSKCCVDADFFWVASSRSRFFRYRIDVVVYSFDNFFVLSNPHRRGVAAATLPRLDFLCRGA